jgi:hypothetical protein
VITSTQNFKPTVLSQAPCTPELRGGKRSGYGD